jgi:hypothetical protein
MISLEQAGKILPTSTVRKAWRRSELGSGSVFDCGVQRGSRYGGHRSSVRGGNARAVAGGGKSTMAMVVTFLVIEAQS